MHFEFSLKLQDIKQGIVSFILKEVLAKHVSTLSIYTADYLVYLLGSQLRFYNACIFKNLSFSRSAFPQGYMYHHSAFTNSSMKLISTPYAFVHAMYSNTKAWLNSDVLSEGKTGENICLLMEAIWYNQT